MSRLRHVESFVEEILFQNPDARDDDNLLFAEFLKAQKHHDYTEVADAIEIGKLATMLKSVERARRKLQQHNDELRGEVWRKRHNAQDEYIRYSQE